MPMNSLVHNCQNNATCSILYISEAFSLYVNILKSHRIFMEVLSHTVAFMVQIAGFFLFSITEIAQNNQPSVKPLQVIL